MNLFKELVITAPVSARLQFGFNENVIVKAVDISVRKIKGLPIKANTFITLAQVDPDTKKIVAQTEFNYWNLDSTTDFVVSNFMEEFTSLAAILDAVGKSMSDFESTVLAVFNGEDVDEVVKTKDGAKLAQDTLQNTFYDMVKASLGENCPLLKIKLVTNKKGFLEIPKVMGCILPMTSEQELPEVDAREIKVRNEALAAAATAKTAKPDEVGVKPTTPGATTAAAEKPVAKGAFGGL